VPLSARELASIIDYAVLKPEATLNELKEACRLAKKHGFAALCVNTYYVGYIAKLLEGSEVKVCAAVGFPLGSSLTEVKIKEAEEAVKRGAQEVDFVANIGLIKSGELEEALKDVEQVVEAAKRRGAEAVKVIVEVGLLNSEERRIACRIVEESGADFIKTCTGFSACRATPEDVREIKRLAPKLKIKASGGIRSLSQVEELLRAGASRIGTSHAPEIMVQAEQLK